MFGYYFNFLNNFMNFWNFAPIPVYSNPIYSNPYGANLYFNQQSYPNSIFERKYHPAKGDLLVKNAIKGLPASNPNPPMCAKYCKNALVSSGLGEYIPGNGEQSKYLFRRNLNFQEIKVSGKDLANLPRGTAIVYDANEVVTDNKGNISQIGKDGHVMYALGDGRGVSDRMENNIPISDNAHVFIPV